MRVSKVSHTLREASQIFSFFVAQESLHLERCRPANWILLCGDAGSHIKRQEMITLSAAARTRKVRVATCNGRLTRHELVKVVKQHQNIEYAPLHPSNPPQP